MEKSRLGESPCPPAGILWGLSGEPFALCSCRRAVCLPLAWVTLWVVDWREMLWDPTEVGHPVGFGLEGDGVGPCWARSYRAAWGLVVCHLLLAMPRGTLPGGATAFGAASIGPRSFGWWPKGWPSLWVWPSRCRCCCERGRGASGQHQAPAPLGLLLGDAD